MSDDRQNRPGIGPGNRVGGCSGTAFLVAMLLWLGLVPLGVTAIVHAVLGETSLPGVVAAVALVTCAVSLLGPLLTAAYLWRHRAGREPLAAIAGGLAAVGGYVLLDGAIRALFPESVGPSLHGEGVWAAVVRLGVLVPYVLLAAGLVPRLGTLAKRPLTGWLGLQRLDLAALLLALAVGALVTLPWPLTGALGDSLTSLSVAFQTLARTAPRVLIVWGLLFEVMASVAPSPGRASSADNPGLWRIRRGRCAALG